MLNVLKLLSLNSCGLVSSAVAYFFARPADFPYSPVNASFASRPSAKFCSRVTPPEKASLTLRSIVNLSIPPVSTSLTSSPLELTLGLSAPVLLESGV